MSPLDKVLIPVVFLIAMVVFIALFTANGAPMP